MHEKTIRLGLEVMLCPKEVEDLEEQEHGGDDVLKGADCAARSTIYVKGLDQPTNDETNKSEEGATGTQNRNATATKELKRRV